MLFIYDNLQLIINSPLGYLDSIFYCVNLYFINLISYLTTDFLNDLYTLKWSSHLLNTWFHPYRLDNLYNGLINDQNAYIWLFNNGTFFDYIVWLSYNIFFQLEKDLYYYIASTNVVKIKILSCYINTYLFTILIFILKYSFIFILVINLLLFTKNSLKKLSFLNNIIFSKFFIFFETEEEIGAIDDALFFIALFILLFSWYFLTTIFFVNSFSTGLSFLLIGFLVLVFFVLCIPLSVLVDFGLFFAIYIRGAGNSTNLLVEILFDLIGTLVVFTRFVVQNIRFVLIFWAYFELFEWIYSSSFVQLLSSFFQFNYDLTLFNQQLSLGYMIYYFGVIIFGIIGYLYYFLHLLILLFIQLGAYFLISFWLFFFFYTSFYLTKTEKYFFFKRYLNL